MISEYVAVGYKDIVRKLKETCSEFPGVKLLDTKDEINNYFGDEQGFYGIGRLFCANIDECYYDYLAIILTPAVLTYKNYSFADNFIVIFIQDHWVWMEFSSKTGMTFFISGVYSDESKIHPHISSSDGRFCMYSERRFKIKEHLSNLNFWGVITESIGAFTTYTEDDAFRRLGNSETENNYHICPVCNHEINDSYDSIETCERCNVEVHSACSGGTYVKPERYDSLDNPYVHMLCVDCISELENERITLADGKIEKKTMLLPYTMTPVADHCVVCGKHASTDNIKDFIGFDLVMGEFVTKRKEESYLICWECYVDWAKKHPQSAGLYAMSPFGIKFDLFTNILKYKPHADYIIYGITYSTENAIQKISDALDEEELTDEQVLSLIKTSGMSCVHANTQTGYLLIIPFNQ